MKPVGLLNFLATLYLLIPHESALYLIHVPPDMDQLSSAPAPTTFYFLLVPQAPTILP